MDDDSNHQNFDFAQLGIRVRAIAISPLIPRNTIDHTLYDHSSVPATVESVLGVDPLTMRDRQANSLIHLLSLASPRTDAPTPLPNSPDSGFRCEDDPEAKLAAVAPALQPGRGPAKSCPIEPTLRAWAHVTFLRHSQVIPAAANEALAKDLLEINDRVDALKYMKEVSATMRTLKR